MATEIMKEQNLEKQIQKQMGCMAGFLQHFLIGKRFYSARRLPISPAVDTTSESERSTPPSPAKSTESEDKASKQTPAAAESDLPSKQVLPLPIFATKGANSRPRKEAPRLSLDSRATTDAKGSLHPKDTPADGGHSHRSPSVIARLMGLEPLPSQPELRRSASESRVSKDLFHSRFIDVLNSNAMRENVAMEAHLPDPGNYSPQEFATCEANKEPIGAAPPRRKAFFDSGDVFPSRPKQTVTINREIEKRIKTRGINELCKDLETLKQILEALQLRGLLHSKPQAAGRRNFVRDESPIVLIKPPRSISTNFPPGSGSNRARRNHVETPPSVNPWRERNSRSPTRAVRSPSQTSRSNSPVKPKPSSVETRTRRSNESPATRRASPVHSPKLNARRSGKDPRVSNLLPRSKKLTHQKGTTANVVVLEDESSSFSGSSITTSTDTERAEYRVGRNLLERCDQPLHSTAEMGATETQPRRNLLERCDQLLHSTAEMGATETQPSPVSVLDSSFYKDEPLTPSPLTTKSSIDFQADDESGELEEQIWSPLIPPNIPPSKCIEASDDLDFIYISDIVRAIHCLPDDSCVSPLLEKQQYLDGKNMSKAASLHRKLIFDVINEIIKGKRRLPPWKAGNIVSCGITYSDCVTPPFLEKIWSEFERIRQRESGEELYESICLVLKKDLAGDSWGGCVMEITEGILDIERLIFKDLICEHIQDLAALVSRDRLFSNMFRRQLVF